MCNTDEVRRVKETTAELFREQRALVERLNAMNERIEAENHPVRKVLRKVKWMEEKDRSVELLGKVRPSPHSRLLWGPSVMTTNLPGPPARRSLCLSKACSRRTPRVTRWRRTPSMKAH
jgi:hypothetical protein